MLNSFLPFLSILIEFIFMRRDFLNGQIIIKIGDITLEDADAVVNAANSSLLGGGGVDGAIHLRGGSQILEECREIRQNEFPKGLPTGQAVITGGGNLKAKFVIHTVGPIFGQHGGREVELLSNCYSNSLSLAVKNHLESVAFPAISTGIYGYPKSEAAKISSRAVKDFIGQNKQISQVRFVFFSEPDAEIFMKHHCL